MVPSIIMVSHLRVSSIVRSEVFGHAVIMYDASGHPVRLHDDISDGSSANSANGIDLSGKSINIGGSQYHQY